MDTQKYTALSIANYFIKKNITPLKLQKLLYFSQVWYFVKHEKLLFKDDIQAWVLGPVVYDVWDAFRFMRRGDFIPLHKANDVVYDKEIEKHLDEIWQIYGGYTGLELVDLTHLEPLWINARGSIPEHQSSTAVLPINKSTTDYLLLNNGCIPKPTIEVQGIAKFEVRANEELF